MEEFQKERNFDKFVKFGKNALFKQDFRSCFIVETIDVLEVDLILIKATNTLIIESIFIKSTDA